MFTNEELFEIEKRFDNLAEEVDKGVAQRLQLFTRIAELKVIEQEAIEKQIHIIITDGVKVKDLLRSISAKASNLRRDVK